MIINPTFTISYFPIRSNQTRVPKANEPSTLK